MIITTIKHARTCWISEGSSAMSESVKDALADVAVPSASTSIRQALRDVHIHCGLRETCLNIRKAYFTSGMVGDIYHSHEKGMIKLETCIMAAYSCASTYWLNLMLLCSRGCSCFTLRLTHCCGIVLCKRLQLKNNPPDIFKVQQ